MMILRVDKKKFEELCKQYGFYEDIYVEPSKLPRTLENNKHHVAGCFCAFTNNEFKIDQIDDDVYTYNLEMAELIDFFSSVGGKIELNGIVTNPRNEEVKGQLKKCSFRNKFVQRALTSFLNTWLEYRQDGDYNYLFNWEGKKPISYKRKDINGNEFIEEDTFFTEPYTEDELKQILQYERLKQNRRMHFNMNGEVGQRLAWIYGRLRAEGIFGNGKQTQRKEYCFLYDYLVLAGKVQNLGMGECIGDVGKEKADLVKNLMRSYERQENKWNEKKKLATEFDNVAKKLIDRKTE